MNVKGIGYILHHSVAFEDGSSLSSQEITRLNFEDIYVKEKRVKKLIITNNGDFNFDFCIKKSSHVNMISIMPENGTVVRHQKMEVVITFEPKAEHRFKGKSSRLSL